jgi:hypothetical protein
MIDDAFGHWLAGFIDGEGCFALRRHNPSHICGHSWGAIFVLKVRDDDAAIIEEIAARTGLGRVTYGRAPSGYRNTRPQAKWQVQSKADCVALADLLDRYPLRAKKARDLAVWSKAVRLRLQTVNGGPSARERNEPIWAEIAELYEELSLLRAYDDLAVAA